MSFLNIYLCNFLIFKVLHWKESHLAFNDYFHHLKYDPLGPLPHAGKKYCTSEAYHRQSIKIPQFIILKLGRFYASYVKSVAAAL